MGVYSITYTGTFAALSVNAGDAAEMESRLQAAIDGSTAVAIADLLLAGAGEGPGWDAMIVAADAVADGAAMTRSGARVAAAVAASADEAYLRLTQRLAELNAEASIQDVGKVEISGGGVGESFMALAIVGQQVV